MPKHPLGCLLGGCNPGTEDGKQMSIDVTNREETFAQLAVQLKVEKFGILDSEGDWSYIESTKNGGFAFSNGIAGWAEPVLPNFPEQTEETPRTVKSLTIYEDGKIKYASVIKVLAYDS